ncbi:Methyltransferase type 11 [Denitrovibrio acetiphilus DSM 12809]|uniref:Methyltransferase type 11 n=1 Tax=Denitrovibrio acetiphilus (strain DSM 12809 / NBRC 114555 / N2460) TaxID=522772 RepID=D4H2D5_DENA2|nr:class I SAM-dependent methyltransferase [Denitrovibrio acetiphilus]ADD68926.1 Methyltransferase type 11 [Denitrovibrio acetiphilus DSM 12809]
MEFYRMLSENYREIFPVSENMLKFTLDNISGDRVLDVGCAKGDLLRRLCSEGKDAWGVEYVPELVGFPDRTLLGDMHRLPFADGDFSGVICTGNTLVHSKEPSVVIKEFARVTKPGGGLVLQILNYDRIMREQPAELPVIQTGDFQFLRTYDYLADSIRFSGKLQRGNESTESSVLLYPLSSVSVCKLLSNNNFSNIRIFGGFDSAAFASEDSYTLVVTAQKR